MRRLWFGGLAATVLAIAGQAQGVALRPEAEYGAKKTISVFVDYSNDSSHIFLGQEQNRKIAGIGVEYSLRLAHLRHFDFSYEADLLPLTFVRDPVVSGVSTVVITGIPPVTTGIPFSGSFSGPTMADCKSGTTVVTGNLPNNASYVQTTTQQCGSRWTYAGGISPMGLRFGFAKRHRLQPLLVNNSARFNFTFEGGAGVEWFNGQRRSWALDYRVHHLSNAYRGMYNPGIDSSVFRVSYRFGR